MQDTIYLLNGPVIGGLDTRLQNQDVTPLIVTMPPNWNAPRTRIRIRMVGTFQLPESGDQFFRKVWMGKTQLTFCSSKAERPNESRSFIDEIQILWYGDNLHAIHATHHTGFVSCGAWIPASGGSNPTGDFSQYRYALPATSEIAVSDAPLIVDGNLNNVSPSFYAAAKSTVFYSVREFAIEKIS